jgi:hypothetical protein
MNFSTHEQLKLKMRNAPMRKHWLIHGSKFALFVVVAVAAVGAVVMGLWNWLMPGLFGWHAIDFWQAVGLLVLSKILLGGFRGHPGRHGHWRARMSERWQNMSEEERQKFREGMHRRCGHGRGHGRGHEAAAGNEG